MHAILHQLRRAALLTVGDGPSDAQLLEAFLSHRDETAFEALVRRYGPMVLAVCRRVTGNAHDAEDAFQATFLVLVRKAASLRSRQVLPGWLHAVAYRTALHTRTLVKKRRAKEQQAAQQPKIQTGDDAPPEELLARLDEALHRLPDRYRLPVVLCELQGHTRKQAAELLGLPIGTVSWRLAHARKLLAQRLARYGTMLSAGAVAAVLSQSGASAVPAALVRAVTVQALATGTIPAPIEALTEGVLKAMLLSKLKVVWGVALALVVGAGVVGLMYRPAVAADPTQPGNGRAAARATADEIEELRLEIAALRKGLQATRERVKTLEDELATLRGPAAGSGGGSGTATQRMMQQMMQQMGGGTGLPGVGMRQGGSVPVPSQGTGPKLPAGNDRQDQGQKQSSSALPRLGSGRVHQPRDSQPAPASSLPLSRFGNGGTAFPPQNGQPQLMEKPGGAPSPLGAEGGQKPQTGAVPLTAEAGSRQHEKAPELARDPQTARDQAGAEAGTRTTAAGFAWDLNTGREPDPLAEAKAALQQLRTHPGNRRAADRLAKALKRLEMERHKQPAGPQPAVPTKR